jgi:hypothetical protein
MKRQFKQAHKHKKAIIFIDEVRLHNIKDCVGTACLTYSNTHVRSVLATIPWQCVSMYAPCDSISKNIQADEHPTVASILSRSTEPLN